MNRLKTGMLTLALFSTITLAPALVSNPRLQSAKKSDVECLARNVYHEARGEPIEGQIAVAQVTVNRAQSGEFEKTVCGVVYAHKQFSWTQDKSKKIKSNKDWETALAVSKAVLTESIPLPEFNALYFHTRQVKPYWAKTKRRIARIGNHIFYA